MATHIGGNERGEAAMADDAPLQRALEDPPQPLLLLQHRLQLRHLRAQPFNPSDKPPLPTEQRRRPSMHGARARSVCSSTTDGRTDLELELEALLALLVPVHEEVHELHLAPAHPRPS